MDTVAAGGVDSRSAVLSSCFGELTDSFLAMDGKALQLFPKKVQRTHFAFLFYCIFIFFNNMKC